MSAAQQQAADEMRRVSAERVWQMEHNPADVRQWAIDLAARVNPGADATFIVGAAKKFVSYVERGE